MKDLLKKSYDSAEQIKGKNLLFVLFSIFVVFVIIGISLGYFFENTLKSDETYRPVSGDEVGVSEHAYSGRVRSVHSGDYPDENISFGLYDQNGLVILLKSRPDDLRLEVSEGLSISVTGSMAKTRDGKSDVLIIDQIRYLNDSN